MRVSGGDMRDTGRPPDRSRSRAGQGFARWRTSCKLVDMSADLVRRLALDVARAEEHAGDGAALEQRLQVGRLR